MKSGKTLLVIGGCGYIGSHIVKRLLDVGHKITALDDLFLAFAIACCVAVLARIAEDVSSIHTTEL